MVMSKGRQLAVQTVLILAGIAAIEMVAYIHRGFVRGILVGATASILVLAGRMIGRPE